MFGFMKKKKSPTVLEISSPIAGRVIPLEQVEDEAFSSKAMGEGFAVEPAEGRLFAPFDGTVAYLMEKSKHALMLEDTSGAQILIHVGMNTVSLKGQGFTAHVATGDSITKGQLLLEFDIAAIQAAGYPVITPVIVPAGQDNVKQVELVQNEDTAIIKIHL